MYINLPKQHTPCVEGSPKTLFNYFYQITCYISQGFGSDFVPASKSWLWQNKECPNSEICGEKEDFCHWNVRLVGWGWGDDVMYFIHGSFTLTPPWLTEARVWVSSFWELEGYITVQAVMHYACCFTLHVDEFLLGNPQWTVFCGWLCIWKIK